MTAPLFKPLKITANDLRQPAFNDFASAWADRGEFWTTDSCLKTFESSGSGIASAACLDQSGTWLGWYFATRAGDDMELLWIFARPESRGLGVARALMADMIKSAGKDHGASKIFLEVRAGNFAAIKLYESFAFTAVSRRRGYYSNGDDAIVYQKLL